MRSLYEQRISEATKIERAIVRGSARICSPVFGKVCKAIWPLKTATELAAIIGCSVRTIDYELSGERHPSAQSIQAVINAIVPPFK